MNTNLLNLAEENMNEEWRSADVVWVEGIVLCHFISFL